MDSEPSHEDSVKAPTISRRFSYPFIGVVTLFLFAFAAIAIFINISRLDSELKNRLDNASKLAELSLPTVLALNFDYETVNDFVRALFLDKSVVYASVLWGPSRQSGLSREMQIIAEKKRKEYQQEDFTYFENTPEFIARTSPIVYEGEHIGDIQLVISRHYIKQQLLLYISGIIALTLLVILAIWLTSIVITRRYIARPLLKLQHSAGLIAQGDLAAPIETGSGDEIGRLAKDLSVMRDSIKNLFGTLQARQDELQETRQYLTRLIESSTDAIISTDIQGRVVLFNKGAEAMLGYQREEVVGRTVTVLYETEDQAKEVMRQMLQRGGTTAGYETALKAKDNTLVPVLLSAAVLHDAEGNEAGTVGFNKDLRQRKRVEEKLRQSHEKLEEYSRTLEEKVEQRTADLARAKTEAEEARVVAEEASRAKSAFLANMSHELRTPLNAIIGFSQVLLEKMFGELNDKQEDYVGDILTSGQHLLNLINSILDLSKVEAGKLELEPEVLDLRQLLESSLVVVKEHALAHGISLSLEIDDDIDTVSADEQKVKQIVFNLLSNAVKFTPDKGKVGIKAQKTGEAVQIAVWDTGVGIAADDHQRVFEEFQQVGQKLTEKLQGTGLGLALTKGLVELHGGTIWLESSPGHGSTFFFTLPIMDVGHRTPRAVFHEKAAEEQAVEASTGRPLVLVIEDDPKAADLLHIYLSEAGYEVVIAKDGLEGLEQVKQVAPDAIILDVFLPEVDGWEFLTQLKSDPTTKDVPVIIVSIVDQKGKGFALGAADYLVKPIEKQALLRTLDEFSLGSKVRHVPTKILAIDDDPKALELLTVALEPEGFQVLRAYSGEEGVEVAMAEQPDIIILDLLMPGLNGFEVLDNLEKAPVTKQPPVIIFTLKHITADERKRLKGRIARLAQKEGYNPKRLVNMVREVSQANPRDGYKHG